MTGPVIREIATRHGRMLALAGDVYVTRSLMVYGEYCPAEGAALEGLVGPGQTVIEVGANMGTHTVPLARKCAPGLLIAFEPQHQLFQILCANLALNGIGNVRAYPEASGATSGWASLPPLNYAAVGNFGGVSVEAGGPAPGGVAVRVTPIDDLQLEACHLIKIDVEGWEAEVLEGAEATIARCRPLLYVENDRPQKQAALIAQIDALGYRQYWHLPPLYSPNNFNGVQHDIFGQVHSQNMFCVPRESELGVEGLVEIDPAVWAEQARRAP